MTADHDTTFHFHTKLEQTLLLGIKATSVVQLLHGITSVPESSVYYHTHHFLLQHQYLAPEPPNDFAYWVTELVGNAALGESLASVDIVGFGSIAELRSRFIGLLESHISGDSYRPDTDHGEPFHFMASRTFVLPTSFVAREIREFRDMIGAVSIESLYYHIFDARLRLGREENDFSRWLRDRGRPDIAEKIRKLDPYAQTMEGLRKNIIGAIGEGD
jgi:hypothetical protein